ncbi:hypothetical protein MMC11_007214 [Xylographa trunciseda]|nr:hypothetical protein [Xylographa trunciseda]
MSSSTRSPSPIVPGSMSVQAPSRRPPRKSTLTQQQKNQKRQRATQDQLNTLEVEFVSNPTPTATVRERIAADINMTERSVQIWFQNRRAKIKLLAKKSIESGEDCDQIPESYRNYLTHQALELGKPLARNFLAQSAGGTGSYGNGGMFMGGESSNPQKVVIHHLECKALSIGTWRRLGQNAMDLVVFYSIGEKPCLTYYINNDAAGYKIEFPFSYIKNISVENGGFDEAGGPLLKGLVVELNRPPNFYMDSAGSNGFYLCGDFTEDQQASQILVHYLGGDTAKLSNQLAKLSVLESFQNRLNPYLDISAIAASAPVSPVGERPSSQPTIMGPPPVNMFRDYDGFRMDLNPHMRGHKRTRSRSVPAVFDFSTIRQPMPSFHVQHPSTTMINDSIFAPIPGYHPTTSIGSPESHDLRIDTSASYGLDFRQYPMSAATTTSPSDYASPSFFTSGAHMAHMPVDNISNGYVVPYLSPMPEQNHMIQPSVSPLSAMSHGDPVIANQSPQLSNMHRSNSADFLSMTSDHHSGMLEESSMLSDMYSKQSLTLPIRSAGIEDTNLEMHLHDEPSNDDFDIHSMVNFGTIDPSNLSPGNGGM